MGVARVAPQLWRTEIKPVRREDVARSNAQEELAAPEAAVLMAKASTL
jgi:hypothetical protein